MSRAAIERIPTAPTARSHPPYLHPDYRSTRLRAPLRPLIMLPESMHDPSGPVYGDGPPLQTDSDLTRQHAGEPLGERIIVTGRVLDGYGKPVPGALIELWQANAAGRYIHERDQHPAPLDPNFTGAGRCLTGSDGTLPVHDGEARRLPVAEPSQRVAARPHPLLDLRARVHRPPGHPDVLPGRSAASRPTRSSSRSATRGRASG